MTGNDFLRIGAPLIAMGAVWAARRGVSGGYKAVSGESPPAADDLDAPILNVILFTVAAAAAAAVVNVVITRQITKAQARHQSDVSNVAPVQTA